MPIYEYYCRICGDTFEEFRKITRVPKRARCKKCGTLAKKVLSSHGAVLPDGGVTWLESAKENLPDSARNIQTRSEWKKYLKKHNLVCVG